MTTVLLIVHLFVTLALIGVVLIQRSEGGGLGVGSTQGMGSFMSGRGTANLLTRTTAILATIFMALSLALALMDRGTTVNGGHSILDLPPTPAIPAAPLTPTPAPAATTPAPVPSSAAPAPMPAPEATAPAAPVPAPAVVPAPAEPAPAAKP
jgi:preprotein translocase subunit SecG